MTPENAKSIAANLNAMASAVLDNDQAGQLAALVTLRANLYAAYYDVLPVVEGQKSWPPIKRGDTWDLNGKPVSYTEDELDPDQSDF